MNVEIASTIPARLKGLYGRKGFDGVLMLVPCNDVHTFAMKHPLDIAFVAADGHVIESHRNVIPNRRLRNRSATATLERFACNDTWYEPGERIQSQFGEATFA